MEKCENFAFCYHFNELINVLCKFTQLNCFYNKSFRENRTNKRANKIFLVRGFTSELYLTPILEVKAAPMDITMIKKKLILPIKK